MLTILSFFGEGVRFLMMNRYPYSAGHLMVVPYRVVSRLAELTAEEKVELLDIAIYAERLLEEVVRADGFNIGWNIVLRWRRGGKNPPPLTRSSPLEWRPQLHDRLSGTRIIPEGLVPMYEKLRSAVERIKFENDSAGG